MLLTSKCCFQLKSFSHNIVSPVKKVIFSKSEIREICIVQVGGFCTERTTGDGHFPMRKRYYELWTGILARCNGLMLKCLNNGFVSYTVFHFTRHQLINWRHVDCLYISMMLYQLFGLSF